MYNVWYSVIWYDVVRHDVKRSESMQNTNWYNWTEVISIQYQNSSRWQASISALLTIHPIRGTDQDRIGHQLGYARLVGSLLGNLR